MYFYLITSGDNIDEVSLGQTADVQGHPGLGAPPSGAGPPTHQSWCPPPLGLGAHQSTTLALPPLLGPPRHTTTPHHHHHHISRPTTTTEPDHCSREAQNQAHHYLHQKSHRQQLTNTSLGSNPDMCISTVPAAVTTIPKIWCPMNLIHTASSQKQIIYFAEQLH